MRIAVIGGTGYVGLTTAVCLAAKGHDVFCIDKDKERVKKVQNGIPVIYEKGLEEMLQAVLSEDKLHSTVDLDEYVQHADVSFICVGTPSKRDGSIDLTQIQVASEEIGRALADRQEYHVVTVRSTVTPGITEETVLPLLEKSSGKTVGKSFGLCMNPEFLREGRAIKDYMHPTDLGIVIGQLNEESGDVLQKVYSDFDAEILRVDIRTAEMIKYARNCYLAKDISFANEVANICQKLGVDYQTVKKGMEMDKRIGKGRFLDAGVGFGGSCFPKDVKALAARAKEAGVTPYVLDATLKTNDQQPLKVIELLKTAIGRIHDKRIAVLGLSFKPGTDDMREAPSIEIVEQLCVEGARVVAYDPEALQNARKLFCSLRVQLAENSADALRNADACIIVTDWPEFSNPYLYLGMAGRTIIDGRRTIDPRILSPDFKYFAIGYPVGNRK